MKCLKFPAQQYNLINTSLQYKSSDSSIIGLLELLWSALYKSSYSDMDRSKAKILKKVFKKLREITRYKDEDKNSRVTNEGPQTLILEEAEFDLVKLIYGKLQFNPAASEDVDTLWEVIESAVEYNPPKPVLVVEDK